MIKGFALIPQRPDISREDFHRHWREVHAPLAVRIKALKRYVQSHRIPHPIAGFAGAPFEGVAEIWFDDLNGIMRLGENPDYRNGAQPDEANFIAATGPTFLATREHVIVPGPAIAKDASLVKGLFLLKRRGGMSPEEFQDYWLHKHGPLVPREPALLQYVQCHPVLESYAAGEPAYDGVAELWWQDRAAFDRYWNSDALQEEFATDPPKFMDVDASVGILAEEFRVIWP